MVYCQVWLGGALRPVGGVGAVALGAPMSAVETPEVCRHLTPWVVAQRNVVLDDSTEATTQARDRRAQTR